MCMPVQWNAKNGTSGYERVLLSLSIMEGLSRQTFTLAIMSKSPTSAFGVHSIGETLSLVFHLVGHLHTQEPDVYRYTQQADGLVKL